MVKLILHNVFKHKFLFILIGVLIMLLCFYLIIGMNTLFSVSTSLKKAVIDNLTGNVIISSSKAKKIDIITKDGEKKIIPLENGANLLSFIRERGYVENASPRLRVWGTVKSNFNEISMIITGVDPGSEPGLLPGRKLEDGRWIKTSNEAVMYYRHSDLLNVDKGATLGIGIQTVDGYYNFDTVKLVGILNYKDLAYYTEFALFCFVSIDYLNSLLMTKKPVIGEIFVRLKDPDDLNKLKGDIVKNFGNKYRYILPENSASLISGIHKLTFFIVYFVAFILLFMVYLGSSFLVSVSVETRRQEIGIYNAFGVKKWRIGFLFAGEFLVVMAIFGTIGIYLGLTIMKLISGTGIEATIIPLYLIFGRSVLYIHNYAGTFLIIALVLLFAFIVNVLGAIKRLSGLDPVEVMREL